VFIGPKYISLVPDYMLRQSALTLTRGAKSQCHLYIHKVHGSMRQVHDKKLRTSLGYSRTFSRALKAYLDVFRVCKAL